MTFGRRCSRQPHVGLTCLAIGSSLLSFTLDSSDAFSSVSLGLVARGVVSKGDKHVRRTKSFLVTAMADENDDETIDSPFHLENTLESLFNINNRATVDPSRAYSVPDVEGHLDRLSDPSRSYPPESDKQAQLQESYEELQQETDGIFLDTDLYMNSRGLLNPDGSLNLPETVESGFGNDEDYRKLTERMLMQHPDLPASFFSTYDEPTLETLLQQRPQSPSAFSEELHRKVFENEQGYLDQSDIFRKSLGTDGEAASLETTKERRGAEYRRRQEEAISNLNREIERFETNLLANNNPKVTEEKCFKCGCILSDDEREHFQASINPLPASQRLCYLCYADVLVATSDTSFFRDTPTSSDLGRMTRKQERRGPPLPRQPRDMSRTLPPGQTAALSDNPQIPQSTTANVYARQSLQPNGSSMSASTRVNSSENDAIEQLKQEMQALHQELQNYKHNAQSETKEDEIVVESGFEGEEARDDSEDIGRWTEVVDPDTGEVFYWNEETKEMKWELD